MQSHNRFTGVLSTVSSQLGAGYVSNVGSATASLISHTKAAIEATQAELANAEANKKQAETYQASAAQMVLNAKEEKAAAQSAIEAAKQKVAAADSLTVSLEKQYGQLQQQVKIQRELLKDAEATYQIAPKAENYQAVVTARNKMMATHQYFQIGGYQNKLVVEVNYGNPAVNIPQRRSKFVYYDAVDLITSDTPKPLGAFSLEPNLVKVGNPQGICITETGLLESHGGYYYQPSHPVNQNTMYAMHRLTQSGAVIESFSCRADEVINVLKPYLKVSPTRLEGQGVIYFEGKIYSINVLGDPSSVNEYQGGLVILEHNLSSNDEGALRLSNASYPLGTLDSGSDINIQIQAIASDRSQNKLVYTLKDILDMMVRDGVNIYEFYNTGLPLVTDLNGNEFPWGANISVHNNDSTSFFIRISGRLTDYSLHVTRADNGAYTYRYSTVVALGDTNLRPEFKGRPHKIQGADGSVREDIYTYSSGRIAAFRFYSGEDNSVSGTIIVDGAAKKTEYLTTSDITWKNEHGIDKYLPDLISEAVADGAAQYAAFKTSPEIIYPMCMAQILNKYFPEAVHVGDSSPENPWMVDASKLVPALMIAIAQLNDEMKKKG